MPSRKAVINAVRCYCGNKVQYPECCGRYIEAGQYPETAEQLMRSRYTGFVLGDESYLLATWHPSTRPSQVRLDAKQNWLGLSVRSTEDGGAEDATGTVEYVARFKIAGKGHRLHEISRFEKTAGRWLYIDGKHL